MAAKTRSGSADALRASASGPRLALAASDRPEGAWGQQVFTGSGEHLHVATDRGEERPHEAGLADAGLAEHECGGPLPPRRLAESRLEGGQFRLTFEQDRPHASIVPPG